MESSSEKPKIINLSTKMLNNTQIDILSLGLKFTPTPQISNKPEIIDDISEFCRRLRLAEKFYGHEDNDESIVKNKSDFRPKKGVNRALDDFCDHISNFPNTIQNTRTVKSNFSKEKWIELNNLRNDKTITIKQADKGSAVVVMDTTHYIDLVQQMLNDQNFYEQSRQYKQQKVLRQLFVLLHLYRKCLTEKEMDYLTNFNCKSSNFYGLPKIHKSKTINEICRNSEKTYINIPRPDDLKLRPIVAGPACETHRLSNMLDILLKPFIIHIRSFIRDDLDMLNNLPESVDQNCKLVSFDVVNLYTNIPHNYGIEAIQHWLNTYPDDLHPRFEKEFVLKGLRFILENNYFNFNDKSYRQKTGTAMGTKVAPTYANLVMGFHEIKMYEESCRKFGNTFETYLIENWKRYLDDCFIIWNQDLNKLQEFKTLLNNIDDHIQFTMESSDKELPFLDILIIKNETTIETDIYFKPTDSKQYLLYTSCHPKHTKNNIPYNLARRICTIVSNTQTRDQRLDELRSILRKRRYPNTLIDTGIQKAKQMSTQELRRVRSKNEERVIPYVSTFNPKNAEMFQYIYQNLPILNSDEKMKQILAENTIIKSKRQPKSLKKFLTSAKLQQDLPIYRVTKCKRPNCGVCAYLTEGSEFHFKNGFTFKIKNNFTCASGNLIYVITCKGCKEEYIGQTGMTIRSRMTVHRQQIRDASTRKITLSEHIDMCAGHSLPNFNIFPIYQCSDSTTEDQRINKEQQFIRKYGPRLNRTHSGN